MTAARRQCRPGALLLSLLLHAVLLALLLNWREAPSRRAAADEAEVIEAVAVEETPQDAQRRTRRREPPVRSRSK